MLYYLVVFQIYIESFLDKAFKFSFYPKKTRHIENSGIEYLFENITTVFTKLHGKYNIIAKLAHLSDEDNFRGNEKG